MSEVRIASGIEIMTTRVDRHEPRNSRIINAVNAPAIAPSRTTINTGRFDEHRLIEQFIDFEAGGAASRAVLQHIAHPVYDVERGRIAVLDDAEQDRARCRPRGQCSAAPPSLANSADILEEHRRAVGEI